MYCCQSFRSNFYQELLIGFVNLVILVESCQNGGHRYQTYPEDGTGIPFNYIIVEYCVIGQLASWYVLIAVQ